jgi:hypothetical protein
LFPRVRNAIIQSMSATQLSASEIVARGTRIYETRLRPLLEPAHNGEYVVIDVETGEYEVDADHLMASDRAAAKRAGAPLYATRVGMRTVTRIGGRGVPRT